MKDPTVGQLIMAGFPGLEAPQPFLDHLRAGHAGGVVLFGRNVHDPAQVLALTESLQEAARSGGHPPLLIAIDHEGGTVQRLRRGVTALPAAMALGATGDEQWAGRLYQQAAQELRAMGIRMNFAPVLDINNNPANPVIGTRAFSHRPEEVVRFGVEAVNAWLRGGVVPCGKHFPGHGDTAQDSHETLPVITHDRDHLDAVELRPFRAVIAAGIPALMTAHIELPAIDPRGFPATLSSRVLTDLLRRELAYDGVVCTDCLEMDAIRGTVGTVAGAVAAIQAGADLCLISHTASLQESAFEALGEAAAHGGLPGDRVRESLHRIARLKASLDGLGRTTPALSSIPDTVYRRAVHVVGRKAFVPLTQPAQIVSFHGARRTAAHDPTDVVSSLVDGLDRRALLARHDALPANPDETAINSALASGANQPLVVLWDRAGQFPGQLALVKQGTKTRKVYVVALTNPFDLQNLPQGAVGLTAFDPTPPAQAAMAEALAGQWRPEPWAF